ncbi:glycosyltransferase family 4 protein [Cytophagaceae bacterium DM2B3-1]|uniref:Glycosyltransferase family 4 protein n=1 Tax=Xanthocytophaga flava TaxID=3048013 RepID=A0ABT7CHW2_9BACT|nr:glycosyltransferase family 4 protein [Xanthocytophaga flavus]MDJ1493272.1 glycosyltransferase family 4 protein [Xanthocytophaga flavus]
MHILLVHQYFLEKDDPGGSRFNEMTRVWAENGHQVTVIGGMVHYASGKKRDKHKGKFIVREEYDQNITVYRCHVSEAYNTNFIGRLWAYFSFVFSSIIAGIFYARKKYNVVLVTSPPLFVGITGYILSRWKRIPLVFEIRDLWPESAIDTGILTNKTIIRFAYWFEKFIYKKSKLINCLTPAFRIKLIEDKKVPAQKTVMIPNAADFSLSEELLHSFDANEFRKKLNWQDKFVITYVGAHGVANHLIQLIDVAESLKDTNTHIVLIGDGMQKPMLREETQKRNLTNVQFVDSVPKKEVFKYILASDLGTSVLKKNDTFKTVYSNKTFDYMSCRKPILMVIDGVSRQLVEEARCGVYAEPENIADIVAKIRLYLSDKERLATDGMNGYTYAQTHFDRENLAKEYLRVLDSISKK